MLGSLSLAPGLAVAGGDAGGAGPAAHGAGGAGRAAASSASHRRRADVSTRGARRAAAASARSRRSGTDAGAGAGLQVPDRVLVVGRRQPLHLLAGQLGADAGPELVELDA